MYISKKANFPFLNYSKKIATQYTTLLNPIIKIKNDGWHNRRNNIHVNFFGSFPPVFIMFQMGERFRIENEIPIGYFLTTCFFLLPIILAPFTFMSGLMMNTSSEIIYLTIAFGTPAVWILFLAAGYVYSLKGYLRKASYISIWPSILSWIALMGYFYSWDYFLRI